QQRGRKKRLEKANALLDPWKRAKKHPPTIEALMAGENVAEGAGFQAIALQLAIYATSVGLAHDEFLARCAGLCEKHVSDSNRYGTAEKRRAELSRMWHYMSEDSLYEFDPGPIARLMRPGLAMPDMGVIETDTREDGDADSDVPSDIEADIHKAV